MPSSRSKLASRYLRNSLFLRHGILNKNRLFWPLDQFMSWTDPSILLFDGLFLRMFMRYKCGFNTHFGCWHWNYSVKFHSYITPLNTMFWCFSIHFHVKFSNNVNFSKIDCFIWKNIMKALRTTIGSICKKSSGLKLTSYDESTDFHLNFPANRGLGTIS